MTSHIATDARANLVGSLWMVGAMALFAAEDALIKAAAAALPMSQILVVFGTGGAMIFALLARAQGLALFPRDAAAPAVRRGWFLRFLGGSFIFWRWL
jgi:uncharacterized membrane-anchored protein